MYVLLILYVLNSIVTINCSCVQVNKTRGICTSLEDVQRERHQRWTVLDVNGDEPNEKLLPKTLVRHINLKKLSIKNSIYQININTFKKLTELSTLILEDNNLQKVNFRIFEDTNIKTVYMSNNNINNFNPFQLDNLIEFAIENEKLPTITEGMFNIQSIQKLSLRKNQIETIEPNTFNGMDNLTHLYLCGNNISYFNSEEIFKTTPLEHLYINDNHIEALTPEMFTTLTELKTLYLGKNQIESIDYEVLRSLEHLEELCLAYNKIIAIEPSELPLKLKSINLSFNLIYFIPYYQFSDFPDLKKLSIIGNPLHCSCWKSIKKQMDSQRVETIRCSSSKFKNGQLPVCFKLNNSTCVRNIAQDLGGNNTDIYTDTLKDYGNVPDCLFIEPHTFFPSYYNITLF